MDELFCNSREFRDVARALRRMGPRFAQLCCYAAQWWDDERLAEPGDPALDRLRFDFAPADTVEFPKPKLWIVGKDDGHGIA